MSGPDATAPTWRWSAASAAAFPDSDVVADVDEAFASMPGQLAAGYTSICFKPSMYTDDPAEVGALCREIVRRVAAL